MSTRPNALPRSERLMRQGDFAATYRARRAASDDRLRIYVRPNGLASSRIGLSVAGRWGNAVQRNKFRRRCREAFRLNKRSIPRGYDIIVLPRATIRLTFDDVAASLLKLTRKACQE